MLQPGTSAEESHSSGGRCKQPRVFGYAYFVVASQAVMALCIGTFLATSVLRYQMMGLSVHSAGLLLAAGEALGCMALLAPLPARPAGRRQLTSMAATLLSRPLHCVPALLAAGAATAAFGLPSLPVAIAGQLILSTLNDVTVSLLNEATACAVRGRADYLRLQVRGRVVCVGACGACAPPRARDMALEASVSAGH